MLMGKLATAALVIIGLKRCKHWLFVKGRQSEWHRSAMISLSCGERHRASLGIASIIHGNVVECQCARGAPKIGPPITATSCCTKSIGGSLTGHKDAPYAVGLELGSPSVPVTWHSHWRWHRPPTKASADGGRDKLIGPGHR